MKKSIIIIAIIIVLIAVIVFFLVQKNIIKNTEPIAGQKNNNKLISSEEEQVKKEQSLTDPAVALKAKLLLQARFFIERYGTYSSDSNYNNWRTLKNQMTQSLFNEVVKKIDLEKQNQTEFYSLTTKVTNIDLKEFNQKKNIVFSAQVQKKEIKSGQTRITQKNVELVFVKAGDDWKVDEISFKP